ncbi:MAG: pitrilysin family protein [Candidatus Shapirobacteria bacterium]
MVDYEMLTLENGLRVVVASMPQLPSATVMVGAGAGSRYEDPKINGLSHFLEHMAFKGTKKRPTTRAIATEVDGIGGEFNASTDREFTNYFIKAAATHLELAFDILSDMLANSLLKDEEIKREKGVIIEEINMYEDLPQIKVGEVFLRLVYGDTPMGWDIAGTPAIIRQMQRSDFVNYLQRLYYPHNMVVVVAGGVTLAQVKTLAEKYFVLPKKLGKNSKQAIKPDQKRVHIKVVNKKTEQAHFVLGYPAYARSDHRRFAESLLATVLGGGMSSRLFLQIRERRGLAYYVGAGGDYYTDSGVFMARAGVKLAKLDEAVKVTLDELRKAKEKKIGDEELTKAKEMLKGSLILALEDSQEVANRYAHQVILDEKITPPAETLAKIEAVTAEEVQAVAKDLFCPEKLNLAVIGPYEEEKIQKLIKSRHYLFIGQLKIS